MWRTRALMKLSFWEGIIAFFCFAEAVVASTPSPARPAICVQISKAISAASEVFYPGAFNPINSGGYDANL